MKAKIDLRIFVFIVLLYLAKENWIYLMLFIFSVIHKVAHIITKILLGKPKPKDYNTKIKKSNILGIKRIIVAASGPLINIIIILIAGVINFDIFTYLMVIISNLAIVLFNLIPVYPMDGGKILKEILCIALGKKKANEYIHKISFVIIILITIVTSIGILYFKNIVILLAIIYLWYVYLIEENNYKKKNNIYEIIEKYWNKIKKIVKY